MSNFKGKMVRTCNHIGLFASDPEGLIAFYSEKIGFEKGEKRSIPAEVTQQIFGIKSRCSLTKLVYGSVVLEVFSLEDTKLEEKPTASKGYNHWGLAVNERESFIAALEDNDVPVIRIESRGRCVFFIRDPEDNLVEIFEARSLK